MEIELKSNVRHNGKLYKAGDIIENISEGEAKRLVKLGDAFFIGKRNSKNVDPAPPPPDKKLDENLLKDFKDAYEYPELKEAAAEIGLEFPGNISFEKLVQLIIDNDKVDEFFEE